MTGPSNLRATRGRILNGFIKKKKEKEKKENPLPQLVSSDAAAWQTEIQSLNYDGTQQHPYTRGQHRAVYDVHIITATFFCLV